MNDKIFEVFWNTMAVIGIFVVLYFASEIGQKFKDTEFYQIYVNIAGPIALIVVIGFPIYCLVAGAIEFFKNKKNKS